MKNCSIYKIITAEDQSFNYQICSDRCDDIRFVDEFQRIMCVSECPSGYYKQKNSDGLMYCVTTCKENYLKQDNECVKRCDDMYYQHLDNTCTQDLPCNYDETHIFLSETTDKAKSKYIAVEKCDNFVLD